MLKGYDHLLFVLALVLIVPILWLLFKTITAFTLAHSVSLALATLGVVNMPGAPTEAVIALCIIFLAVEILHSGQGRPTLTERNPWVVALGFGLFHGLGFAGALACLTQLAALPHSGPCNTSHRLCFKSPTAGGQELLSAILPHRRQCG